MPSDPSAPSFDLDDARATSQRLTREVAARERNEKPATGPEPAYTRFDASRIVPERPSIGAARVAASAAAPATPSAATIGLYAAGSWEQMLDWFLQITQGHTCFVMDPQGLSAAARGRAPDLGDAIGPRLMIALEQAGRMQPDGRSASSVLFEFGDGWITGVSVETIEGSRLTVGVLSDSPIERSAREVVARTIREKLESR